MIDRCKVGISGTSSGREPTTAYAYGSEIRCRYSEKTVTEIQDGSQVTLLKSWIRVPPGTTISGSDRILLTRRNHTVLQTDPDLAGAEKYRIMGRPNQTTVETICSVELITGGGTG